MMMKLNLLIIILFLGKTSFDCDKFKTGKFEVESKFGGKVVIQRNHRFHTETLTRNGNVVRYKIKWISDCSFLLYGRQLLKGTEEINDPKIIEEFANDTIFNEIIKINGNVYTTKSKLYKFKKWYESTTRKIE
ncbi:hypothetical protein [Flavobacterium sp. FlaQc-48]|uniref:hypothetical protein n=1 Tax=Flavobacterium sp. FlaQc-48 TaxID=3374181 RepID=UPI0037573F36